MLLGNNVAELKDKLWNAPTDAVNDVIMDTTEKLTTSIIDKRLLPIRSKQKVEAIRNNTILFQRRDKH